LNGRSLRRLAGRLTVGVLVLMLAAVSAAGCARPKGASGKKAGALVIGLASDIMQRGQMDPAASTAVPNMVVTMNIFDNLVYSNTDGTVKAGLAESWTVSPDAKTYTFVLRKGVKFHDDTPLNAEAVKFMFDRILDPKNALPARPPLGPVDKVIVKDANTVEVQYKEPFAALLNNLTSYNFGVPSPTAVQKLGKDFGSRPVGSGPFVFKSAVPGQSVTLEKNKSYNWPPLGMYEHSGPPYLDSLTFKFIPEEVPRMGALETGDCNAVVYLSADGLSRFKANPSKYVITLALVPGMAFGYYLNVEKPPLNELPVRQAILYSLDQKTMVDTLYKGVVAHAKGPLSPASMGYSTEIDAMYPFDAPKARKLLDDAGWRVGSDGFRYRGGQKLSLRFAALEGQRYQMASEWIQAALKEVGIEVKLEVLTSSARIEAGKKGTHHATMAGNSGNDPDLLRPVFSSSQVGSDNYARIKDAEIDAALAEASRTADKAKRIELYRKALKKIQEQAVFLPIWYTTHAFAQSQAVKGLRMDGSGYYILLYDTYVEQATKK
jgi:peptide/nickel transport system substrate-binding protein